MHRELTAVDPRHVLGRGYSYTTDARGVLIRSIRDVRGGDRMRTHVSDGMIESIVGGSQGRARKRKGGRAEQELPGLFDES